MLEHEQGPLPTHAEEKKEHGHREEQQKQQLKSEIQQVQAAISQLQRLLKTTRQPKTIAKSIEHRA